MFPRWFLVSWDQAERVWRRGRVRITPQQAARKRWRYVGPALSAADLAQAF